MKILRTFSGKEFILEDDEAENVIAVKNSGKKAFLQLRSGEYVDTSAIEAITKIPLIPVWNNGRFLSKDGRSFIRDGTRIYIERIETFKDNVLFEEDPRYTELHSWNKIILETEEEKRLETEEKRKELESEGSPFAKQLSGNMTAFSNSTRNQIQEEVAKEERRLK